MIIKGSRSIHHLRFFAFFGILILGGCSLWKGTDLWRQRRQYEILESFSNSIGKERIQLGQKLQHSPTPPEGFPHDINAVKSVVAANPLIFCAVERRTSRVFILRVDSVTEEMSEADRKRSLENAQAAINSDCPSYSLPQPPEYIPIFMLVDAEWVWFMAWDMGREEVEGFLNQTLGPHPSTRVGIWPVNPSFPRPRHLPGPGDRYPPTSLQGGMTYQGNDWLVKWPNVALGPNWQFIFQPWPKEIASWEEEIKKEVARIRIIGILFLLILLFLVLPNYLSLGSDKSEIQG